MQRAGNSGYLARFSRDVGYHYRLFATLPTLSQTLAQEAVFLQLRFCPLYP
jgi:hypothetical protein